ncbi:hypothetical protein HQ529_00325 [Candidatus Woesearchaeota archaeon]|nr:hypothetical protein [Candidatus Woesearchaeota archaeon]
MRSKKILLTIPEPILKELLKERDKYAYSSIQEVIMNLLRDNLIKRKLGKNPVGRPRKLDEVKVSQRKKLFDKNGVIIN